LFGAAAVRHSLIKINVAPVLLPQILPGGIAAVPDRYDGTEKATGGALNDYINRHPVDLLVVLSNRPPRPAVALKAYSGDSK
jgi:hypothetical protein